MTTGSSAPSVPGWPGEDFACPGCGVRYADTTVADALRTVADVPGRARAVVEAAPVAHRNVRPHPDRWSLAEYVFHLRDVYVSSTIRLHRVRTEDRPLLEPMLNDLRARRFGYNALDAHAGLDELDGTVRGFVAETRRIGVDGWSRAGVRRPGEQRTALWFVRHAAHEGHHHVADLAEVAAVLAG